MITGRRYPAPGERWRLWRCHLEGPLELSCGCIRTPEVVAERWARHEGRVVTILPLPSLGVCPNCRVLTQTIPGGVSISLPMDGFTSQVVPYTWLEPENWRP